jgi:nucleotide-binding universal stress UspA family protein
MARTILVLLNRPETATWLLSAGECLAELIGGADIQALVVRAPREPPPMLSVELATPRRQPETEEQERHRCEEVYSAFQEWLRARPELEASTRWQDVEALVDAVVVARGRQSDFIILEKARRDDDVLQRVTIGRALFETGRPVLVMPHRPCTVFGRRVAVLWRDDKVAVKAVLAAIPWLAQVATVEVIVGAQHSRPTTSPLPILAEHGIAARLHSVPVKARSTSSGLLAKVHDLDCDMIVMGAYGRGILRGIFLGSVTDDTLAYADRPVLLCH